MFRYALAGDGSSAANYDVVGRPGWAWVRFDEKQDHASQVRSQWPGWPQDLPIVVGKKYPSDKFYQVLSINSELYQEHWPNPVAFYLPIHGTTHTWGNSDPAPIDIRNLLPGRLSATSPSSMSVRGEALRYEYNGILKDFSGDTIDLTAYVPGVAGQHRGVLVSIDPATNTLVATPGVTTPTPVPVDKPDVPAHYIPLGIVVLANGDTEIDETDIYDYRILLTGMGAYIHTINQIVGALEGEMDLLLTDQMMRIHRNRIAIGIEEAERDLQMSSHVVEGG